MFQNQKPSKRSFPISTILFILIAFVIGGLFNLVLVNRLLARHLIIYAENSAAGMAAISTILDLMDNLLFYFFVYGQILFLLLLTAANIWAWFKTESLWLRYGITAVIVLALLVLGVSWVNRVIAIADTPPPTLPTPTAEASSYFPTIETK